MVNSHVETTPELRVKVHTIIDLLKARLCAASYTKEEILIIYDEFMGASSNKKPKSMPPGQRKTIGLLLGFSENIDKYLGNKNGVFKDAENRSYLKKKNFDLIGKAVRRFVALNGFETDFEEKSQYGDDSKKWDTFADFSIGLLSSTDVETRPPEIRPRPVGPVENDPGCGSLLSPNFPSLPKHFTSYTKYERDIAGIRTALLSPGSLRAITVLWGLRGVGKTTLAAAYAHGFSSEYRLRWWISGERREGIEQGLFDLGVARGWASRKDSQQDALMKVKQGLNSADNRTLLIYDNIIEESDLDDRLPQEGAAHIIITSNNPSWGRIADRKEVESWPGDVGGKFLRGRCPKGGALAVAKKLSEILGGLPLALEQAAAYCDGAKVSFNEYIILFNRTTTDLLGFATHIDKGYHRDAQERADRTVLGTFTLVLEKASDIAAARDLLVYAALLAAEPVPLFLFYEAKEEFGSFAPWFDEVRLNTPLAALTKFSLVSLDRIADPRDSTAEKRCISLHRLVKEIAVRNVYKDERVLNSMRRELLTAMFRLLPSETYTDRTAWPTAHFLLPHGRELIQDEASFLDGYETIAIHVLDRLAGYVHGPRGDAAGAVELYERALRISESLADRKAPIIGTILHSMAWAKATMGQYREAKPLFLRALEFREKALPPDDPDRIETLHRVGWVSIYLAEYDEAEKILEHACELFDSTPAQAKPVISTPYSTRGWLCMSLGRYDEGIAHYEYERGLLQRRYNADDSVLGWPAQNIGLMYLYTGQLDKAETELTRAFRIRMKEFGRKHSETAMAFQNCAMLLMAKEDYWRAEKCARLAVWISGKVDPEKHSRYARCVATLAEVRLGQEQLEEAESLALKAQSIRKEVCSIGHPDLANSEVLLARILSKRGDAEKALSLARRAVPALRLKLTDGHIWVRTAVATLEEIEALLI